MMKATIFLAGVASILSSAEGLNLPKRQDGPSRVVSLDIERKTFTNPVQRDRVRRRDAVEASLDNEQTLYFINTTIGTPPQSIRLHLDTGSSDLWVNTPGSELCLVKSQPCQFAGAYSANSSSTYEYVGSYFNISYVDGSGASGDYVSDTVTIGQQKLKRLQFGIGYSSTSSQGILGIGYEINEVQVGRAQKSPYKNLPSQMVADGLIQSKAFSLWLNDLGSNTGSILFGGVDSEKYTGPLETLPIQSGSGVFSEFLITLTDIQLGTQSISSNIALAVLLDSGSSLTYLPDEIVQDIFNVVDGRYDTDEGVAYVPCSLASENKNLTFTFSSPKIAVSMKELVLNLVTNNGKRPAFEDGVPACLFGIAPAGRGTNVLGDTFLRSAYVVYDLDNNEISLAQTRFNTTSSAVLEIGTGNKAVPHATSVAEAVKATQGIVRGNAKLRSSAAAAPAKPLMGAVSAAAMALTINFLLTTTFA